MATKKKAAGVSSQGLLPDTSVATSILNRFEAFSRSGDEKLAVGLFSLLLSHLEPLTKSDSHSLAKHYVPFLARILKLCSVGLSRTPLDLTNQSNNSAVDELISSMGLALDRLEKLRAWLVGGCPFEIELQRYWLARRLMALKRYGESLTQTQIILNGLACNALSPGPTPKNSARVVSVKAPDADVRIPPPSEHMKAIEPTLVDLVVGASVDLFVCTSETGPITPSSWHTLHTLLSDAEPWLQKLDADRAERPLNLLFKAIHKCALAVVENPANYGKEVVKTLCIETFNKCISSSLCDRFVKVSRNICSHVSSHGPEWSMLAVDLCEDAFVKLAKINQLQALWSYHEVLDLVEYYARLCQNTKRWECGWRFLCNILYHDSEVLSTIAGAAVGGLYAVGMLLSGTSFSGNADGTQSCPQNVLNLEQLQKASDLLDAAINSANTIVNHAQSSFPTASENQKPNTINHQSVNKSPAMEMNTDSKSFIAVFKALDFLRKSAASYVQLQWSCFVAKTPEQFGSDFLKQSLENALNMFCEFVLLKRGCNTTSILESECFLKASQSGIVAATSALKLSLIGQGEPQKILSNTFELMSDPLLRLEELRWLISTTYNMGVQLFNLKQFCLACEPFKLSYKAAWSRVSRLTSEFNETAEMSASIIDAVSEACSKSVTFADALYRSSRKIEGKEVVVESICRWGNVAAICGEKVHLGSLIKIWMKNDFVDGMASVDKAQMEKSIIYPSIRALQPPLSPKSIGILLEEELFFLETVEDLHPSVLLQARDNIFDLLLEKIYINPNFAYKRSKILLEKARFARLQGCHTLSSCLTYLAEAISCLEEMLKLMDETNETPRALVIYQLASTLCIRALCSQEADPDSQVFMEDIKVALQLWKDQISSKMLNLKFDASGNPIWLLQNVMDLLALKGYSLLQYEVHKLLFEMASLDPMSNMDKFVTLCGDLKFSHILCLVPIPKYLPDIVQKNLGLSADSIDFWQDCSKRCTGSFLDTLHKVMRRDIVESATDEDILDSSALPFWMNSLKGKNGLQKTIEALRMSEVYYMLAKYDMERGYILRALGSAKEGLCLRLKILNCHFKISDGGATVQIKDNPHLEAVGDMATSTWPSLFDLQRCPDNVPTQWKIIGVYVESLMQVGVLYELMGAVDEAEKSFREGLRIATLQNLPLACSLLNSCLGEVYRKRHLWDLAESSFRSALDGFTREDAVFICAPCRAMGEAMLELRTGDLIYCRTDTQTLNDTLATANDHYSTAEEKLSFFNGYEFDDSIVFQVGRGQVSKSGDELTKNSSPVNFREDIKFETLSCVSSSKEEQLDALCEGVHSMLISKPGMDKPASTKCAVNPNILKETVTRRSSRSRSRNVESQQSTEVTSSEVFSKRRGRKVTNTDSNAGEENKTVPRSRKRSTVTVILSDKLVDSTVDSERQSPRDKNINLRTRRNCAEVQTDKSRQTCQSNLNKSCWCEYQRKQWSSPSVREWNAFCWNKCARQLMAKLLIQKGKCVSHLSDVHKVHEIYSRAMTMLQFRCSSNTRICHSEVQCASRKKVGSVYPLEEAALLYHLSKLVLRHGKYSVERGFCCWLGDVSVSLIASWLLCAFFLCSEAPDLFQKVSKLLAILHVPHAFGGHYAVSVCSELSSNMLSAYFHQASLGTTARQEHLLILETKISAGRADKDMVLGADHIASLAFQSTMGFAAVELKSSFEMLEEALRVVPRNVEEFVSFVQGFMRLPFSTICMSFVDDTTGSPNAVSSVGNSSRLVKDYSSWLLITRFDVDREPLVMLLPVTPLPRNPYDESDETSDEDQQFEKPGSNCSETSYVMRTWQKFLLEFNCILEESRKSTTGTQFLNTTEEKSRWWQWRIGLDSRLSSILQYVEKCWLGPWKCVLLGHNLQFPCEIFQSYAKDLRAQLEHVVEGKVLIDMDLVTLLLQGAGSLTREELETASSWLVGWREPFTLYASNEGVLPAEAIKSEEKRVVILKAVKVLVGSFKSIIGGPHDDKESNSYRSDVQLPKSKKLGEKPVPRNLAEDFDNVDIIDIHREPVVLVLDKYLQALPWESLPVLRKNEVYRMPSISAINALLARWSDPLLPSEIEARRERVQATLPTIPSKLPDVDPFNTYYLLNPSGDLESTQIAFEDWFKSQSGWKGKVGEVPSTEEYMKGLEKHDLFVYFGHGSGDQYLPQSNLKKMQHCAATLLMGCSSGRLLLRGDYDPAGVPLSYLMAGCPAVIANLWDVTDGDIDRFSRALLCKWLSPDRTLVANQDVGNPPKQLKTKGKRSKKTATITGTSLSSETPIPLICIATFIGEGRNSCKLPYLIGSSPVCYGVPTIIKARNAANSTVLTD